MTFDIGDIISVENRGYRVIGRITYINQNDQCKWDEYRLSDLETNREAWLSVDTVYQEYSISQVVRSQPSDFYRYHEVDRGTEVVVSRRGSVDVDFGESAGFIEYEDQTEELIISMESWSDGVEWSVGHYIDDNEFTLIRHDKSYRFKMQLPGLISIGLIALVILLAMLGQVLSGIHFTPKIRKYLKKSENYTYVTSVTGNNNRKAQVYLVTGLRSVDSAARDIIYAVEGETQYVQQDDSEENGAVAILTEKEYCIVYPAEDEGILVQVSDRKYAYTTDDDLYRGTRSSRHYYRRFYHSTGYTSDSITFRRSSSPYSSYSDTDISYSNDNTYSSYSDSVRQSSISARQSSGGGLSGGK